MSLGPNHYRASSPAKKNSHHQQHRRRKRKREREKQTGWDGKRGGERADGETQQQKDKERGNKGKNRDGSVKWIVCSQQGGVKV